MEIKLTKGNFCGRENVFQNVGDEMATVISAAAQALEVFPAKELFMFLMEF